MIRFRPSALITALGATALAAFPALASPPPGFLGDTWTNADGAAVPIEFTAPAGARATPIDPALIAQVAGHPTGLRGACPELVDLNGEMDGDMPREVAFLADGVTAVIVNRDSNNVTYLDTTTRVITGATPVGEFPVFITVTPNGQYILTANTLGNSVSVIDAATRQVVAEVPVTGTEPYRIAVTSDSARAIVGVINNATDATFSVIDLTTFTEVSSFPGGVQGVYGGFANSTFPIFGNTFGEFELSPDDQTIVLPASGVPSNNESTIYFFDVNTGTQTAAIIGPQAARAVDISPDGTMAAVSYIFNTARIDIFDMATQTLSQSIPTATNLDAWVKFTPDGSRLITGYLNDTFIIDRATGAEVFRTQTGTIGDLEITHDGNYLVVPNFTTRVIDLNSPSVVGAMSYAATADMAVSPNSHIAVGLNNRFGEDAHVYSTNGASSAFLGAMMPRETPEGDAPFDIDISADGQTAVIGMTVSSTVAIVDVPTRTMRSLVTTGKRVMDVAITPDGTHAVICNGDSDSVSIIDLSNDTVVATLPVFTRPAQVKISPDSSTAYVLNIAGTDQIHFINLAGASSSVVGTVLAGQTGAWGGPQYSENSAIELSPDGSLLAVCDSFNDFLLLIDTATQTQVAAVPTGDFPIRVAFSADGSMAYVTNAFGGSVTAVSVAGASSFPVATIPLGTNMLTVAVDENNDYLYITDYNFFTGSNLYVVDTETFGLVSSVFLDGRLARDTHYDASTGTLMVATNASGQAGSTPAFYRINAAGPATSVIDVTPLSDNTYDMAYTSATGVAIVGQPFLDAADFLCFGGTGCPVDWNGDDAVNSGDISSFLTSWIASVSAPDLTADFNGDGQTNSGDISAFLTAWIDAVTNGC